MERGTELSSAPVGENGHTLVVHVGKCVGRRGRQPQEENIFIITNLNLSMGIFDFLKGKKKESKETEDKILLAMPLFAEGKSYDLDAVLKRLEEHWQQKVTDKSGDGGSAVFSVNGYMVAMAFMPVAVPGGDIEGTLPYTYIWTTAKEECSTHKGHAIVSLLSKEGSLIERYKIFTMEQTPN